MSLPLLLTRPTTPEAVVAPEPPSWDLGDLTGIVQRYNATSMANLYQDTGTSTPVTAADDPVGHLVDLGSNGYELISPALVSY